MRLVRAVGGVERPKLLLAVGADAVPDHSLDPPQVGSLANYAWFFGKRVAGAGDVNGDGWPDWCVAYERTSSSAAGGFAVYPGGAKWPLLPVGIISASPPIQAMCGLGDQNGDGLDDFAVGCPGGGSLQSYVRVYLGEANSGLFPVSRNSVSAGALWNSRTARSKSLQPVRW